MCANSAAEDVPNAARQARVVVVCGLPGAGKTTVSEHVSERVDGRLLRTDVVRTDLFPDPEYTDAEMRAVYDELFDRARAAVRDGDTVVLDGTFQHAADRERAESLADDLGAPFALVKVECSEDVVRDRIEARTGDESDADFAIHQQYREAFDALDADHVAVDNSGDLDGTLAQVDRLF